MMPPHSQIDQPHAQVRKDHPMHLRHTLAACLMAATVIALPSSAFALTPQQQPTVTAQPDAGAKTYPIDQIVTATVHDAWLLSGKNEDEFFNICEQLAVFSAQKRGLTLPDSAAAGRRMGQIIKTRAKADHDQLLYSIVDQAVRTLATKPTTPPAQ
jgi:hypothetical protein